ncbi:MAG: hypothetical protein AB7V43_07505 [Acidimicrobiia bacterium]
MTPDRFDHHAIARGLVWALAVAVPAGLISPSLDRDSWVLAPLTAMVMAGLIVGAATAARRQVRGLPLAHGLVTALIAWAFAQSLGIVRRLIRDSEISGSKILSSMLLSMIAGTIGGLIGSRRANRRV